MTHVNGSLSGSALARWCVCLWLCATSCSPTPTNPGEQPASLPTLDQIRSQLPQAGLLNSTPDGQLAAMLYVSQLDVPLKASTEPAWALTDDRGLDPLVVDAWRANGLRVGVLKPSDYEPFIQALATDHPARNKRITLTEQPAVCTTAPKHNDTQVVRLALPPAQRLSTLQVGPGRFQFLARLVQGPRDAAQLRLTPHHYQPRTTVQPRLPQEKIQDGLVFDGLALSVPASGESWLVIGLDIPQTAPSPSDDTSSTDTPPDQTVTEEPATPQSTTQPTTQPSKPKPSDYVLPNHLGRALFTASRFNKPIQIVVIIAVTEARESTPPAANSPAP